MYTSSITKVKHKDMMPTAKQNKRIIISTFHTVEVLQVADIVYLQGYENCCKIHLEDGSHLVCTSSFGSIYMQLSGLGFYHCHKSYVINFCHMVRYYKEGDIELCTGKRVPLARRRKDLFFEELHDWCIEECNCSPAI